MPWTLLFSGVEAAGRTLRLTLTGEGGGEWRVPLGAGLAAPGEPDTHITADVVGFCFLLGGRGEPETFQAEVAGDAALAATILRAAPALSGP